MKIKKIIAVFLTALIILMPCACSKRSDTKIVLITGADGKKGSYTDKSTYEALETLSEKYDFELEVIEPSKIQNYEKKIIEIMSDTPKLVIYSNPSSETEAVISARNYSDTYFVLVGASADINLDGAQDVNNIYAITFSRTQAGFISGIYAGSRAQKNICFIGGKEYKSLVEYEASFRAGVMSIASDSSVQILYLGDDDSDEAVTAKLNEQITDDCDIIYTVKESKAVYDYAEQKDITVIGAVYDYSSDYPYKMSFLIKNDVQKAISMAIDDYFNGTFQGQIKILGFADEGLTETYADKDDPAQDIVSVWKERIIEGAFQIPSNRNEADSFIIPQF